jgi:hypothetical protein
MAGILDQLGGLLSGMGQSGPFTNYLGDNRNALMALGLGLASGDGWGEGAKNALTGFVAGQGADRNQRGQMAAYKYVMSRDDISPELKAAMTPEIAYKFMTEAAKPPTYQTHATAGNVYQSRPDQPGITPVARLPEAREVDDGKGGKKLIDYLPGEPVPNSAQRSRPYPGSYQGGPQGGFQDRFSGDPGQPAPGQMQPNRVRTIYEPPPPENPEAMAGKPTDEQNKAAGFAKRMFNAEAKFQNPKIINAATTLTNRQRADIPVVGNYLVPKEFQQFDQASRDFINAILRRESGAVIQPSEFVDARKQYLPAPGDDPDTLKDKRMNRQTVIRAMAGSAGPTFKGPMTFDADGNVVPVEVSRPLNAPSTPQPKGEQGRVPPTVGEVRQGYRFRGGNPADPNSWERTR